MDRTHLYCVLPVKILVRVLYKASDLYVKIMCFQGTDIIQSSGLNQTSSIFICLCLWLKDGLCIIQYMVGCLDALHLYRQIFKVYDIDFSYILYLYGLDIALEVLLNLSILNVSFYFLFGHWLTYPAWASISFITNLIFGSWKLPS